MDYLYLGTTSETQKVYIKTEGLFFEKLSLSQDAQNVIKGQLENWQFCVNRKWYREDLVYNAVDEGESCETIMVKDIKNMNGWVASDEISGALWVENSEFIGVIIKFASYEGFGLDDSISENYVVFKTNGEVIGESVNRFGHCSTEVDEWSIVSYSLKYKE